jgi:hypothetical protein
VTWRWWEELDVIQRKLDRILVTLGAVAQGVATMPADFAALEAQVKKNTDVEASAVVLLTQLHTLLVAAHASGDPAQMQAVIDQLGTSTDALAAAIEANTVTAP